MLPQEKYFEQLAAIGIIAESHTNGVFGHLTKACHIDPDVVQRCIEESGVWQETEFGNIIFPVFDHVGNLVGAETKPCSSGIKAHLRGTLGQFGYKWIIGDTVRSICYFTTTIDLLAFVDYYTNIDKAKPLKDVMLVALHGSHRKKPIITYNDYFEGTRCTICVHDNELGHNCMPELPHFYPHTSNGLTAVSWHELLLKCKGFKP